MWRSGMLGDQRLRHLHLPRRRGDREPRRDRVKRAPLAVPAGDQRLAVVVGGLGGVADARGAVAVHHHLAADHPQAAGLGGGEDRRRPRSGATSSRRPPWSCRARAGGRGRRRRCGRHGRVGEARLLGEGVGVQPVEELRAPGSDHLCLRHVDVGVDEPRHHQVRPVVDDLDAFARRLHHTLRGAGGHDPPVADQDRPVLAVGVGRRVPETVRFRQEPQQTPAQDSFHA